MPSAPDPLNPNASPVDAGPMVPEPLSRDEALRQLRQPATGLMGSSALSVGWASYALWTGTGPGPTFSVAIEAILVVLLLYMLPGVIFLAAWQVRRGRVRIWPWIAIVTGLIPLGTGGVCVGVPCALWLLFLMMRKDIRAALAAPA